MTSGSADFILAAFCSRDAARAFSKGGKEMRKAHSLRTTNLAMTVAAPGKMLAALTATVLLVGPNALAQCPATEFISGLRMPLGITRSNRGNLIVGEAGTFDPNTGRISIVDPDGVRRTLLDGLPSGINDVGEPSGPAGVFMRGRTLYVAVGVGDSVLPGPEPNPDRSSPIFSSVLAIHFSANIENTTEGSTLSLDYHQALADGEKVKLSNAAGDRITVERIADFPDFTDDPTSPTGLLQSNPFDLVVVGDRVYVTDGARNLIWQADIDSGAFSEFAVFPTIANPLPFGPPAVESVPTGIAYSKGRLLTTLFRGFPFPAGTSVVAQIDPQTGSQTTYIDGLTTAIDVLPTRRGGDSDDLVLEFTTDFLANQPGRLRLFETPGDPPTPVADCLVAPTSMTLDEKTGLLYVTELAGGRIVTFQLAQ
jgi:hypothetical protein